MMGESYYITHVFFMPTQEAREAHEFKMEQARQSMKHSLLAGTTNYVKASQTDVAATFARVIAGQQGKAKMRKVKG